MTPWEIETTFAPVPFDPGHVPDPPKPKRKPPPRRYNRENPALPRSKADMLLLVIAACQADGLFASVRKEDIIVAAWEANKAAFGLAGYHDKYPNSNRVIAELVKMKDRGQLSQPVEGHYALTDAGRAILVILTRKAA